MFVDFNVLQRECSPAKSYAGNIVDDAGDEDSMRSDIGSWISICARTKCGCSRSNFCAGNIVDDVGDAFWITLPRKLPLTEFTDDLREAKVCV